MTTKDEIIEYKKYFSDMLIAARKKAKSDKCFICNKKITSSAKSHTLPQFILREIDNDGLVCTNLFVSEQLNSIFAERIGIQKASVFRIICDKCEHKLFNSYESKEAIISLMDNLDKKRLVHEDEIKLAAIFLKSTLKEIYTKTVVDKNMLANILDERVKNGFLTGHNINEINNLNLIDYKIGVDKALDVIFGKSFNEFSVYYHKVLNYQAQFATQAVICVKNDFCGGVVNDIEDLSEELRMDDICVVIFPFDKKTHIIIFGPKNGKERYSSFFKQLKNMTDPDKLKAIQALIFSYTEEIYINPSIYKLMENDNDVKILSIQGVIPTPYFKGDTVVLSLANNDITHYKNIKNCYLSNKFAKH